MTKKGQAHPMLKHSIALIIGFMLLGLSLQALAQQAKAPSCEITITSPKPGTPVGPSGTTAGTAQIPTNSHLWVLAHKKTLNGWWPQGGGETLVDAGKWGEIEVTYGQERDRGEFEIAVVAVTPDAHKILNDWVDKAPERNYPPTRFPAIAEGCPVAKVTVVKQ